ncbi:adenosylcobinamide amidohydrolase [Planomicrobium sp. CPCC 101110]|uniref:adenosylcobinamide amidohydrolase n=1 Tax=Planomicrobium sp. CPCC 101110 TaxID=2599619 RepID=UPI0011B5B302|nr:adenosylcobinamide amidohydrolase [Planomicrobium sp. CPCC 101110]TWT27615.1 ATP-binding cassette domain-containing protein [Planomicrobium sp. CPCC 101110]
MLRITGLTGGYGEKKIVSDISFHVEKGSMLGILGPNGSGKSTLMKLISGVLPAKSGKVEIDGQPISGFSAKELARKMAVLPQLHAHAFEHTVRETVSLGRYPHQSGWFASWSEADEAAVVEAMGLMNIQQYENTLIDRMSGGEQQRVFVAQALAQDASILLLDEPTNHLDINHQKELLDTIKKQAIEKELTVVSIFHDINLASMYCDGLLLLDGGQIKRMGEPHEVVREQDIEAVYKTRVSNHPHPELPKPQITLLPGITRPAAQALITAADFAVSADHVLYQSPIPLKTVSSAVINAGAGWYRTFMNRHVDNTYECDDSTQEMAKFIEQEGFKPTDTVGMMTAVRTEDAIVKEYQGPFGSVVIAVTAGVGNAVDVSKALDREVKVGTINTWIFINGDLSDEAFIQAMITATEAKSKALHHEAVMDPLTNTIATGTSTDSCLVAATQQGEHLPYAGPVTELGKLIGAGVFECTVEAIRLYREAKKL